MLKHLLIKQLTVIENFKIQNELRYISVKGFAI